MQVLVGSDKAAASGAEGRAGACGAEGPCRKVLPSLQGRLLMKRWAKTGWAARERGANPSEKELAARLDTPGRRGKRGLVLLERLGVST